jgi:hypothetical protein
VKAVIVTVRGVRLQVFLHRLTRVYFSGGAEGRFERGWYCFWTAAGRDRYGEWTITGRARQRLSPADRFTRIEREMSPKGFIYNGKRLVVGPVGRKVYRAMWARLRTVQQIRPSSYREVLNWINSHDTDAKFIKPPIVIQGKAYKRLRYV